MKMHTAKPRLQPHLRREDDEVDDGEEPNKLSNVIQNIKKNFHRL
jgi:hypothetical protein